MGWEPHSPREEISPEFKMEDGVFTIDSKGRRGATGQWQNVFPVKGGGHYEFTARRRVSKVDNPRRQVVERSVERTYHTNPFWGTRRSRSKAAAVSRKHDVRILARVADLYAKKWRQHVESPVVTRKGDVRAGVIQGSHRIGLV